MSPVEMESILQQLLHREAVQLDPPSVDDWQRLEAKFSCKIGNDFRIFIELMSTYHFPGDILNVSSGRTNGNDSIELAFDFESREFTWKSEMIPFYSVGNGDYFCLNSKECPYSKVYYFYADRLTYEAYSESFEEWVKDLPAFLA